MARILSLANNKGGVAKTTTTTNLAQGLAIIMEQAKFPNGRVLVIDMDSQAHSTLLLTGNKEHSAQESIGHVLWTHNMGGDVEPIIKSAIKQSTWHPKIDVMVAHPHMNQIEDALISSSGNVFFLRRVLKFVEKNYDVILIDTCPKISLFTKMALMASQDVIIPVAPQFLDADGLIALINEIHAEREAWESKNPSVSGIIVTKFSNRVNGHSTVANNIKAHEFMGKILLGIVPMNSEIEYSQGAGKSIFDYNMDCKGSAAYANLAQKLAHQLFAKA